ncbi:MAG: hypothetical protein N2422_00600 [Rhodobacteraceae bacterium]|nr:hypothetical protein [Paracoccaceae bacterium]
MSTSMRGLLESFGLPEGLSVAPLDFKWEGPDAHLAPTRVTPLSRALHNKTGAALFVLCAGSLLWAARRLENHADVTPAVANAEVLFCYQADARYFSLDGPAHLKSKLPVAREVIETLCYETSGIFFEVAGEHSPRPPITAVENVISVTRHVIGQQFLPSFRSWVSDMLGQLARIAANPRDEFLTVHDFDGEDAYQDYVRRNVGHPFPPSVLNVGPDRPAEDYVAEFRAYLPTVDWRSNPYLAPPDVMMGLGSTRPYTYAG